MRSYRNLFLWENSKKLNKVNQYHKAIVDYTNEYVSTGYGRNNPQKISKLRGLILKDSKEIEELFFLVGESPYYEYGSRASGTQIYTITKDIPFFVSKHDNDVINGILDMYLRLIGIYEKNKFQSFINTINPIFYIRNISNFLISGIFSLFSIKNTEVKGIWGIFKIIIDILVFFGTIWGILVSFGFDIQVVNYIKTLFTNF